MPQDYVLSDELSVFVERYLDSITLESRRNETIRRYRVYFSAFQNWLGARSFTQSTYEEYIAYLQGIYSVSTVLTICSELNNLVKYLWAYGILESDFSRSLDTSPQVNKSQKNSRVTVSAGNIYMFASEYYKAKPGSVSLRSFAVCELLYNFGMRVDELIDLQASSISGAALVVGKPGNMRILKREKELVAVNILASQRRALEDYLLSVKPFTPLSSTTVKSAVNRAAIFGGYSYKFIPAMFRQAKTIELVTRGWKYYEIAAYLGCSDSTAKTAIEECGGQVYAN